MLGQYLYVLQEVKSIIYVIHANGTGFAFTYCIIVSVKFCNVTLLYNFILFHSFITYLPAGATKER